MVQHDDIAQDVEVVFAASLFERPLEDVARVCGVEVGQVVVAAEIDGVVLARGLVTLEACRHGWILDRLRVAWRNSRAVRRNSGVHIGTTAGPPATTGPRQPAECGRLRWLDCEWAPRQVSDMPSVAELRGGAPAGCGDPKQVHRVPHACAADQCDRVDDSGRTAAGLHADALDQGLRGKSGKRGE